jgi:hypothetical protein
MTDTTYTTAQIHEYATTFKMLSYDASTDEYFSIYGQYAPANLIGTRRIVSRDELVRCMERFSRDVSQYGCE